MQNGYSDIITGNIIDRKFLTGNIEKYNGVVDLSNTQPTTLINATISMLNIIIICI